MTDGLSNIFNSIIENLILAVFMHELYIYIYLYMCIYKMYEDCGLKRTIIYWLMNDPRSDILPAVLKAQLVEHCTGIVEFRV